MFEDYDQLVREMEREMRRLADQAFAGLVRLSEGPDRFWQPRVDVHETGDHILVIVEVAGLDRDHYRIELDADGSALTIRGLRRETAGDITGRVRCHQLEIYYGPFRTRVSIPSGASVSGKGILATYEDGLLRIVLPRERPRKLKARSD